MMSDVLTAFPGCTRVYTVSFLIYVVRLFSRILLAPQLSVRVVRNFLNPQ
jgi:hypothetical protein